MKKAIVFLFSIILLYVFIIPENALSERERIEMIPDDAIRLRILANSDSEKDQGVKLKVRDEVNQYITELVKTIDDIDEARRLIDEHVPEIERIVGRTLKEENQKITYSVQYNDEVDFPDKMYGNYFYPAGEYEAVLITLGEGLGENWWCVLFPPLCFLDFSDDEDKAIAETDDENDEENNAEEEVEIRFFLLDWLGLS